MRCLSVNDIKDKDENGNEVELTHGNFNVYRESKDRRVRERHLKYFGEFKISKHLAICIPVQLSLTPTLPMSASTMRVRPPCSVVTYRCPYRQPRRCPSGQTMRRYIDVQRVLGLPEIDMFDLYTPIVDALITR